MQTEAAILFDLDGTLIDTAPDLVGSLNRLLAEEGKPPVPFATARNSVSRGAVGLIDCAHRQQQLPPAEHERLRIRLLEHYAQCRHDRSEFFISPETIAAAMGGAGSLRWGIVTNKPRRFTVPLLQALGCLDLPGCLVCGDDLEQRKPHPAPLLEAASQLGMAADRCIYVGDAHGDVVAARAANMRVIAAGYGYIPLHEDPLSWQADAIIARPEDLVRAVNTLLP